MSTQTHNGQNHTITTQEYAHKILKKSHPHFLIAAAVVVVVVVLDMPVAAAVVEAESGSFEGSADVFKRSADCCSGGCFWFGALM